MTVELMQFARAADYAARRHIAQRRKGERGEPYINHLTEVTALLAEATDGADPVLLLGGLLHDVVEDTDATIEDLSEHFGTEVADLVAEVTDDKSLPQAERKRLQIETVARKSQRAKLLKIADKTSNLRSLVASPPMEWTGQRLADYVDWAARVVDACRGLNTALDAAFDTAYAQARARFCV